MGVLDTDPVWIVILGVAIELSKRNKYRKERWHGDKEIDGERRIKDKFRKGKKKKKEVKESPRKQEECGCITIAKRIFIVAWCCSTRVLSAHATQPAYNRENGTLWPYISYKANSLNCSSFELGSYIRKWQKNQQEWLRKQKGSENWTKRWDSEKKKTGSSIHFTITILFTFPPFFFSSYLFFPFCSLIDMCVQRSRALLHFLARTTAHTANHSWAHTQTNKHHPLTGFTPFCFLFCFDKLDEGKGRERSRPTVENQLQVGGGIWCVSL